MQVTVKKLNRLQDKVEYCLQRFPHTRNSDIDLFTSVCENFYPPFERPLYSWRDIAGAMHQVPSLDHIARCRRKVIELSKYMKYLPTDKNIALGRNIMEKTWLEYATQEKIPIHHNTESNVPIGMEDIANGRF